MAFLRTSSTGGLQERLYVITIPNGVIKSGFYAEWYNQLHNIYQSLYLQSPCSDDYSEHHLPYVKDSDEAFKESKSVCLSACFFLISYSEKYGAPWTSLLTQQKESFISMIFWTIPGAHLEAGACRACRALHFAEVSFVLQTSQEGLWRWKQTDIFDRHWWCRRCFLGSGLGRWWGIDCAMEQQAWNSGNDWSVPT